MNNLLWKQWRENRVHLVLFLVWMVLAACYCVGYELAYEFRAIVGQFSGWTLLYSIFSAIFLGMYVALGERTSGTIGFSRALPVSIRKLAAYRISGAACTLAIPVLIAAAMISLALIGGLVEQAAPRALEGHDELLERESGSLSTSLEQLWSVAAIGIFGGIELLLILSLIGTRLRTQSQLGFFGAVLGLGSLVAGGLLWYSEPGHYIQFLYGGIFPQSLVIQWSYEALNGGSYTDHELARYRWYSLALAIPILLLLGRLFVRCYGQLRSPVSSGPSRFRYLTPAVFSHLNLRLRRRWSALLWLEMRQSLPLVLYGFLFALLITVFTEMTELDVSKSRGLSFGEAVRSSLPHSVSFVGLLWATVVGSGIYASDLDPRVGAFWRSRPISPAKWFWCKYLVGWLAVIVLLDGVTSAISWTADRANMTSGMSWSYVGCYPILHTLIYSLAVLGACWWRKPVIGSFCAFLIFFSVMIAAEALPLTSRFEPLHVYNQLLYAERDGVIDFTQHGYPLVYGSMLVVSFGLAWVSSRISKPLLPRANFINSLMT